MKMPNWQAKELGRNEYAVRLKIIQNEKPLSFQEVLHLWKSDTTFIQFYTSTLQSKGFSAFYWEHPPLQKKDLDNEYEVILQKSRGFDHRRINETAFKDYFQPNQQVAVFDNLGNDALLVVPTKMQESETYKHFGSFLQNAQTEQIQSLFQEIGNAVFQELEKGKQIWLNTAGLGVIWLHVRLDTRPKYYKTQRYKEVDYFN